MKIFQEVMDGFLRNLIRKYVLALVLVLFSFSLNAMFVDIHTLTCARPLYYVYANL